MCHNCCRSTRDETGWIGEYFDTIACDHCEEYKESGLSASSMQLINFLVESGLSGKTLLDLGCGSGCFSFEALKKGAKSTVGIDLSRRMIEIARQLASERGLASKTEFLVGDAARQASPSSDVVILDKVICCYPQLEPLLERAAGASGDKLGIVLPRDVGIAKIPIRLGVYLDNFVSWMRRDPSRMYLHSRGRMDDLLRDAGLELRRKAGAGFWLVLLYVKKSEVVRD